MQSEPVSKPSVTVAIPAPNEADGIAGVRLVRVSFPALFESRSFRARPNPPGGTRSAAE